MVTTAICFFLVAVRARSGAHEPGFQFVAGRPVRAGACPDARAGPDPAGQGLRAAPVWFRPAGRRGPHGIERAKSTRTGCCGQSRCARRAPIETALPSGSGPSSRFPSTGAGRERPSTAPAVRRRSASRPRRRSSAHATPARLGPVLVSARAGRPLDADAAAGPLASRANPSGVWPLRPRPASSQGSTRPRPVRPRAPRRRPARALGQAGAHLLAGTRDLRRRARPAAAWSWSTTATCAPPTSRSRPACTSATRARGAVIGTLAARRQPLLPARLPALGAAARRRYLDPLVLVGAGPVRLLPLDGGRPRGGVPPLAAPLRWRPGGLAGSAPPRPGEPGPSRAARCGPAPRPPC